MEDALMKLFVKHLVGLNQLENLTRARVLSLIKDGFNEVNSTLLSEGDKLTKFQRGRQLALYKRTGSILQDAYGSVEKAAKTDLFNLSKLETRFTEKVMQMTLDGTGVEYNTTRLGVEQLRKIIELPIQGYTNSEWWRAQALGMSGNVKRQIQLGLFAGEGVGPISKR